MPADVSKARFFKLNTDFPMDQIIWLREGSFTVPDNTISGSVTIAHGLSFVPLARMVWSNTSDFSVAYVGGDQQFNSGVFDPMSFLTLGQSYDVSSDISNVYIGQYNVTGASKTVYWRIFAFMPSNASEDSVVPFTADQGDDFILNTDYNYMKVYATGRLEYATPPTLVTFNHNLGYVPRVFIWSVLTGGGELASPLVPAQVITAIPDNTTGVYVTTTQIVWQNPVNFDAIEYRIYLDEG